MQAAGYGADRVILVDSSEYESYSTDAYTACVTVLVDKYKPSVFLLGATNNGRDLGPRVACRLKTGLTADCTSLDIDEESKNVAWTRPAFGGNLMATILCPEHRPQMGTVRPGVFKKPVFKAAGNIPEPSNYLIEEEIRIPENMIRTKLVEQIHEAAQAVSRSSRILQSLCGCRLDPPCPSGRTDRQDGSPKALYCLRHLRSYPTPCGNVRL